MTTLSDRHAFPALRTIALTGIGLVGLWCPIALAGWLFDIPVLTNILPGFARMSVPTISCFFVAVLGVFFLTRYEPEKPYFEWLKRACAFFILLISGLALGDYFEIGLPTFEQPHQAHGYVFGRDWGQVAVATAMNFGFFGVALLTGRNKVQGYAYASLMTLGLFTSCLAIVGYSFGVAALYKISPFTAMSLPTAMSFIFLFASALLARPSAGWISRIVAADSGGVAARRLLPTVIIVPTLLAWGSLEMVRQDIFDAPFGFAFLATTGGTILAGMTYYVSHLLGIRDKELQNEVTLRSNAQNRLRVQVDRLNLLNQITHAISVRQDLSSIFQVVIRTLEDQLPIDFACICLYDPVMGRLTVQNVGVKSMPLAREMLMHERAHIKIDENGLSRCVSGLLIYESDITTTKFPFPLRLAKGGLKSLVLSPLKNGDDVFGVLITARNTANAFSSSDCEFLGQLSQHVAVAASQSKLHGSLQIAYDDLRQSQQAAMQRERLRALGQMASGITHDINNAISPISILTQSIIETEVELSTPMKNYLGIVNRQIDDVAKTISRLREFYREGEPARDRKAVNISTLTDEMIEISSARWKDMARRDGATISMHAEIDSDLPMIIGDESELREAIINLIFNAVDAMPTGGDLYVRTRRQPNRLSGKADGIEPYVILEVEDTGHGMDEETLRRCMEPFYSTKGERGTGLGLAMVFGITERHDGNIDITSTKGEGTKITLTFPVPISLPTEVAAATTPKLPKPMRLLLVDDDPYVLDSLCIVLQLDKHIVVGKSSGHEAVDLFAAAMGTDEAFEAVITDLGMPYMDGNQFAREIKTRSEATPVIMLTGWGQRLGETEDAKSHVNYVLPKPPSLHRLREVLLEVQSED
jgi:signal transduction histidine kinase/ActR/RegA family two-component response regulator